VIDDIGRLPEIAPPAPPPSRPRRVAGEIKRPERLSGRQPLYTELARRVRLEGTVIVDAVIDENGRVTEVELLRGLGFGLDEEVVDAVGTWQFRPATLGGKPIAVLFTLTVHFDLK
jgi:TonB family protein